MIQVAQRGDAGHRSQKNILYQILDSRRRNASKQNAVHHARIAFVKKAECGAIPGLRRADEFLVRRIARNRRIHGRAFRERELQVEVRCHE
jgi:hypothetical protein